MNEDPWQELMTRNGAALRRVVATYERDPARQEDLFQEICLAVWKALPSFRGDASERTYLFRIAHNRGLSHAFHRGRRREREAGSSPGQLAAVADPRPGPEATTAAVERHERLLAAMRRLPVGQRQVLALALEGLPHREIAEVVGISESNVAVRLHRARGALRAELTEETP